MGGKPSAPASRASRGEGLPLLTFSAVSSTIDSDCRERALSVSHGKRQLLQVHRVRAGRELWDSSSPLLLPETHHHLKISMVHLTLFLAFLTDVTTIRNP